MATKAMSLKNRDGLQARSQLAGSLAGGSCKSVAGPTRPGRESCDSFIARKFSGLEANVSVPVGVWPVEASDVAHGGLPGPCDIHAVSSPRS